MASKNISRLTAYITGQTINADEHNAEHQQYIDNLNELFKSFDYDGTFHYLLSDKTKFTFSNLNLEQILSSSHNADGTVKANAIKNILTNTDLKNFLDVAHNPDGTIKSDGISDPLIYAHNNDSNAHPGIKRIEVVSPPTITGSSTASIGYSTSWQVSAESYLNQNVSIAKFIIDWGDGSAEEVPATSNTATISHTYTGAEGETKTISVIAVDTLGNKSKSATLQISLVNNQPPDVTNLQVQGFPVDINTGERYLAVGQIEQISFTGATDPEGQPITYEITDSGILIPSKTTGIADGELINIQAPAVNANTSTQLSVIAKDNAGLASAVKSFNVIVRKTGYGAADIFGDGSCIFYAPLKNNTQELVQGFPFVNYANMNIQYDSVKGALIDAISAGNGVYYKNAGTLMQSYPFTISAIVFGLNFNTLSGGRTINTNTGNGDGVILPYKGSIYIGGGYFGSGIVENKHYFMAAVVDYNGYRRGYAREINGVVLIDVTNNSPHQLTRMPNLVLGSTAQYGTIGIPDGQSLASFYVKNLRIFNRPLTTSELDFLANET